jgi:cysteine-S-conjugate beta-lyase
MNIDTLLTHLGCDPEANHGVVNPPVYHASTITFSTLADMEAARPKRFQGTTSYGRYGTPTHFALETAVAAIEGGYRGVLVPSGLAAVTTALLGVVGPGDHLLMVDTVYGPTRGFCDGMLKRLGVETTYYDPSLGAGVAELMRPNTKAVYVESPGSLTFEVQDIPAIAAAAHQAGAVVLMDNTWGTPLYFKAFAHGVDVSIHAGTKYIVGHSDAMLGVINTTEPLFLKVRETAADLGMVVGPDDVYLALRGLRTLSVRLERHQRSALTIAAWLQTHPAVAQVLYPALPGAPTHDLWRRDFTGASGLFGVVLKPAPVAAVRAMIDGMGLFRIGASWGGFESLILPADPKKIRTATVWEAAGPTIRLHVGLEDPADLIADLQHGFDRLAQTG